MRLEYVHLIDCRIYLYLHETPILDIPVTENVINLFNINLTQNK